MLRTSPLVYVAVLLAACSQQGQEASSRGASAAPTAPSADALAAKAVAQRYFDLLHAQDYPAAYALWVSGAVPGGAGGFANAQRGKGQFVGRAGAPSEVRISNGARFVLVEASTRLTPPNRPLARQDGVIMLKRPAAGAGTWRIWGVDLRRRRCRIGQQPQGLGCVDPKQAAAGAR